MVIGKTVTVSTTPALLHSAPGRRTPVVLSRVGGGNTTVMAAGEVTPADWFTLPASGAPVTVWMERGEELRGVTDQYTLQIAVLVTGE